VRLIKHLWSTPVQASLATLSAVMIVVAAIAASPVTVYTQDSVGPLRGRCGLRYAFFGASNRAVDAACHVAYRGHVQAFTLSMLVLVASVTCLVVITVGRLRREPSERHP
jgi:hypothetical protein